MSNTKNPRGAGRKPLPEQEKMVKYGGGLMPKEMIDWIEKNDGIKAVRNAINYYRANNN